MFENIRLAFQGIWSHKMRSFLTMLGYYYWYCIYYCNCIYDQRYQ